MVEITEQYFFDKYTVLVFNTKIFDIRPRFRFIIIDGVKYEPGIPHHSIHELYIEGHGDFVGKKVQFVMD